MRSCLLRLCFLGLDVFISHRSNHFLWYDSGDSACLQTFLLSLISLITSATYILVGVIPKPWRLSRSHGLPYLPDELQFRPPTLALDEINTLVSLPILRKITFYNKAS
jgi:hypothetical protein